VSATPPPQAAVREELARAFSELRPHMLAFARRDAELDPQRRADDISDDDIEQFFNAYEALFRESLEGSGRDKRDLILETALPPVMDLGSTALDLVRGNVVSAVLLTHRLLPRVSEGHRDAAARWLAVFFSDYSREVAERALALERERQA
jgi:hypothetical protein